MKWRHCQQQGKTPIETDNQHDQAVPSNDGNSGIQSRLVATPAIVDAPSDSSISGVGRENDHHKNENVFVPETIEVDDGTASSLSPNQLSMCTLST